MSKITDTSVIHTNLDEKTAHAPRPEGFSIYYTNSETGEKYLFNKETTVDTVMEALNCGRTKAYKYMEDNSYLFGSIKSKRQEDIDRAKQLRADGWSIAKIAEELGKGNATIIRWLA